MINLLSSKQNPAKMGLRQDGLEYELDHPLPPIPSRPSPKSGKKDSRPRISEHLPADAGDVPQILANWKVNRQGQQNLAAAIRLYDALIKGDFSTAVRIFPGLGVAIGAAQNVPTQPRHQRARSYISSSKTPESESKKEDPEKEKRIRERMIQLAILTQMDLRLYSHEKKLRVTAEALDRGGDAPYTRAELDRCVAEVIPKDYRYKPGEAPSLFLIEALISKVRALPAAAAPAAAPEPPEEAAEDYTPVPAYRGEFEGVWLAARDELRVIIGAKYPTLIGPMKLVNASAQTFIFVVPTANLRDAIRSRAILEVAQRLEKVGAALGKTAGAVVAEVFTEEEWQG